MVNSQNKLTKSIILTIILCFAPIISYGSKTSYDFAVAKINNKVITYYEVQDRYRFLTNFSKVKTNSQRDKSILINQIIDKMIDEELIRQEAKKLKISVSESEIRGVIEAIAQKKRKSYNSYKKSFLNNKISFENYQKQIEADLMWSKIVSGSVKSKIKITDYQIKEFLEQRNQETDISKYKISEIYIPNKENADILTQKLYQELIDGANFEDIVKQFSQSPTIENFGEIGWVSKNDINNNIYEAISSIKVKSYTKPVKLNDGIYIFKLLDKKTVTEINNKDRNFAKTRIFMKELDIEGKAYLIDLHKKSFIEIYKKEMSL